MSSPNQGWHANCGSVGRVPTPAALEPADPTRSALTGSRLSVVERYDPGSDSWTTVSSMPTAKTELGAATLNGEVYAAVPREELIDQADPRALGDVAGVEQLVDPVVDLLLSRAAIGEMLDEVLVRDVVATAALLAIAGGSRASGSHTLSTHRRSSLSSRSAVTSSSIGWACVFCCICHVCLDSRIVYCVTYNMALRVGGVSVSEVSLCSRIFLTFFALRLRPRWGREETPAFTPGRMSCGLLRFRVDVREPPREARAESGPRSQSSTGEDDEDEEEGEHR